MQETSHNLSVSIWAEIQEGRKESPAFGAPPIAYTPAVTVNICMGEVGEQGVLPVATIILKHMAGL